MPSLLQCLENQKTYFKTGHTKDVAFRKKALIRLRESIQNHEQEIIEALHADFNKPAFESMATEISVVLKELNLAIQKIWRWQLPKKVKRSLLNFPSSAKIHYEPYGSALVISPWNYPFQLAVGPIIGAIAAGNTVVLKPSELAPHAAMIIEKIISEVFKPEHVTVVQGAIPETRELLKLRWDYIFFTGSVSVGKIVYQAAAQHLTPVTLELGGKSPCIVDETAHIKQAAKRIVWGKFVNAGQTCIAPDYVLVHHSQKKALLAALAQEITKAYGKNPEESQDFARIISDRHYDRLALMLEGVTAATGGSTNKALRYIAPTLLDEVSLTDKIMQEEIFGPILPVLSYHSKDEIISIINRKEKPLSAYVFSQKRDFKKWFLQNFSFGGGAINDTLIHFVNDKLPFGGVGHSGIGRYHGKHSFYTFSHAKSIVTRATFIDIPLRYAPYKGKLRWLKAFLRWL